MAKIISNTELEHLFLASDWQNDEEDVSFPEDSETGSDCESSGDEVSSPMRRVTSPTNRTKGPNRKETSNDRRLIYACPVCLKELKTISGFRGHVSKQHERPDLKAGDHIKERREQTPGAASAKSGNEDNRPILQKAFMDALENIINSATRNLSTSKNGSQVIDCAKKLKASLDSHMNLDYLLDRLIEILDKCGGIPLVKREREIFTRHFHRLRLDKDAKSKFVILLGESAKPNVATMFYQNFLQELLSTFLKLVREKCQISSDRCDGTEMSKADFNVLFYITGYIFRKANKHVKIPATLQQALTGSEKGELSSKYSEWTQSRNRGGLQIPTETFLKLIIQMDNVHSQHVNVSPAQFRPESLEVTRLRETMADDGLIRLLWESICISSGENHTASSSVLEYIIKLFTTVKGFAIVRHLRRKLTTKQPVPNKSLRGVLKENNK